MSISRKILAGFLLALASGCGNLADIPTVPEVYALDAVKLIGQDLRGSDEARTYSQEYFRLGESRRLLLRLETLREKASAIHITEEHRAILELTLGADEKAEEHRESLKLCPLTRNWMMLATWSYAHPFGRNGAWSQLGADYSEEGCITPSLPKSDTGEETEVSVKNQLHFDISTWYQEYSKASGTNFGWVLLSGRDVVVHGDGSSFHSPRLRFRTIAKQSFWDPHNPTRN